MSWTKPVALLLATGLLLAPPQGTEAQQSGPALSALAGWQVPGIGAIVVPKSAFQLYANGFSATLPIAIAPNAPAPTVVGFRPSNRPAYNVAVILPRFSLPALAPELASSPLADIVFDRGVLMIVPSGNAAKDVPLPPQLAKVMGTARTTLVEGASLIAFPTVTGNLGALLSQSGVPRLSPPLSGTIDPSIFAGAGRARLTRDFFDSLALTVALAGVAPTWKPGYLSFENPQLSIKGEKGSIVAGVRATVIFDVGAPLRIPDTLITRDSRSGAIALSGGPIKPPAGVLSLPANIASLDSLSFVGAVDGNTRTFTLTGVTHVAGKPETFTVTLSGTGTRADYAFSLGGTRSLADLLGWQLPGLGDIQVSNITVGSGGGSGSKAGGTAYTGGTLQIGGIPAKLFVFKPAGTPALAAITLPSLHLPDLIPAAAGTALDGLRIAKPGFILAPPNFPARSVALPAPAASHIGLSSTDPAREPTTEVKSGLNLKGLARPSGATADLLKASGLGNVLSRGLPLSGSIDPRVLKAGSIAADIAQAIIASIDFSAPLGALALPPESPLLSAKSSILSVKGHPDGVKVGLSAELTLAAGPHRYAFDSTITVDRQAGATETTVTGDYPAASQKARGTPSAIKAAFGIPWLTLDDVQLAVTLGPRKSVAVSGKTSLGKVKNLTASVFVDAKGSQVTDFGVSLMGADIGLADIPRFAALKRLPDIRFRDVTISETEVAGTLRTSNSTFNNLRAVVFRTGDKLTLAALRDKFTLEDILQLEGPAKLLFSKIAFDRGLLVISEGGVRGAISSLPSAAAKLLTEVYGDANRRLNLGDGFNLAVAIDTSKIGSIGRLGVGRGKLVLDGGVEGIFGGTPAFDLSVAIPPITFPPTLGFLGGPRNLQTAFFIKLTSADATAGVSVSGDFPVKTKTGSVVFTNTVDFQLDAEGGVSIEVAGTSNSPWPNPFGIHGLTLNPGTTIDVKVSATSEVDLTFIGKSTIGTREVDLTGSAGVLVAEGVLDKGAFEGKVSELKLSDLIALTNTAVTAAGGKMPATNFPEARLTHVDVAFASPGAVVQGMNMVGAGARIAGDLWLLLKNQPLGKLLAQIDGNGVVMSGSVSDLTLGPVALHGNTLDARATLIPPVPPYFKLKGGAKLFGRDQDMDVALSVTDMEMSTNVDLGELLKFDFKAKAGLPGQGLSVAELAKFDMSLNARLRSDLPAWLRGPGRKPVEQAFASVRSGLAKFTDDVRAAQKTVDGLNGQIDAARAKVKSEKRSVEQNLKAAEDHVNALQVSLKQLDGDISEAKSHIHSKCDFWEDKCVVQGLRKCVTSARVPDLSRNASCAADNTRYGAIVGLKTTQRDGVAAANTTAGATLNALRKGVALNDVDLDPRVAPLIVERDIAQTALSAALLSAQGSERASKAIDSALDSFARKDAFVLNDSLIQGSLQKSIAGLPVVLGLDFSSLGTKYYNGFAFSVTDPAFDGEQLATLGLFIASKLLDESYGKDPAMAPFLALVHDAYASRRQAEQARVDAALKENGLE